MEVEKRGVKGGIFQFFDWNGKSRKKLFSSKSDVPESSNRGKENYHGSGIGRHEQGLERGFPPNSRAHNDYHYASSASGDSDYGTKAPGVVARLMGLDSLPTSNVNEPCFTPFIESHSFSDSSRMTSAPAFQNAHDIVIFESVRNKLDGLSRNPLDMRLQRVPGRPLERFQTEVLPPKSTKPISVTHHRLLSPIKSPGFIPPKNAAYIIEATAKMIEQSPRSTTKSNFQSVGSSFVPLRVRDLKEKVEAHPRLSRSVDTSEMSKVQNSKSMKKQLNARGKGRLEDSYRDSEESKIATSRRLRNTEKSGSLAIQAKTNIQKRDGLTSVGSRNFEKQKERNDVKPRSVGKGLPNMQKKMEMESSSRRPSEVLRLNNQKQNCASTSDRDNFGPSCSQPNERKDSDLPSNCIHGRMGRTVNKIVVNSVATSRKTNFVAADDGKDISQSRVKIISKRKLPVNRNIQSGGIVPHKEVMTRDEKSLNGGVVFDGDSEWDRINNKNNLDVISFTFTSPIKKSGSGSSSCNTVSEATSLSFPNYNSCVRESNLRNSSESSSGINIFSSDALSVLLEQKLKELTSMVEVSQRDESEAESFPSSVNSYRNIEPTFSLVKSLPTDDNVFRSKQEIQSTSDFPYIDRLLLKAENDSKARCIKMDGDNVNIELQRYAHLKGPISVSSQPSLSGASTDSFCAGRFNEGQVPFLSPESYEGMNFHSISKSHPAGGDIDISDTASSLSVRTLSETVNSTLSIVDSKDSSNWVLQYIRDILGSGELFLEDFALGQAHKITAPDLFHQLENQKMDSHRSMENHISERKVLFDCVCECIEARCGRLLSGSYKLWANGMIMLRTRECLADNLYREISSRKNVDEVMVDELVDKDMSSKNEKWIDFEIEAFEEGVEIERGILTSLVDELIYDFLF